MTIPSQEPLTGRRSMSAHSWLADPSILSGAGRWIARAAAFAMGVVVLVWVGDRSRPTEAEVVIHVMEPDVVVSVGARSFPIEGRRSAPLVCSVSPGIQDLVMRRGDRILYEERLEILPGEQRVCTAWLQPSPSEPLAEPSSRLAGAIDRPDVRAWTDLP
jgi:hypothetical protein